jgi:hypothetical protein
MSTSEVPSPQTGRLAELRVSARGWHGVQLAVIGFIGLCGVLKREGNAAPSWLEAVGGILAFAALGLACLATYLVGRAAWPLYNAGAPADDATELVRTSHRLTRGLLLTFVAVGLLALGAAPAWWPSNDAEGAAGSVEVQAQGQSVCGQLAEASPGTVRVVTAERPVEVRIAAVTAIRSVDSC